MTYELLDYLHMGVGAVFSADPVGEVLGIPISMTLVMVFSGLMAGILVGAIPGLSGPFAMAVSLPILLSSFGFTPSALLPVLGFLIGLMKGSTLGGAVPAILFNTPGTPDALMTTYDGYPMAKNGQAGKALRVAHFSCVAGDTFSDLVLITCAPFLAVVVERYLDYPEKAALIILAMAFIAAVVGASVIKGLLSGLFGMFVATIGTGEDATPRLTFGIDALAGGFPLLAAVLGVLIIGELLQSIEELARNRLNDTPSPSVKERGDNKLHLKEVKKLVPYVGVSAVIGTIVGALPGIGSTLGGHIGLHRRATHAQGPDSFWRRRHGRCGGHGSSQFGRLGFEPDSGTESGDPGQCGRGVHPAGHGEHRWPESGSQRVSSDDRSCKHGAGDGDRPVHAHDDGQLPELDGGRSIHAKPWRDATCTATNTPADCLAGHTDRRLCAGRKNVLVYAAVGFGVVGYLMRRLNIGVAFRDCLHPCRRF